MNITLIGMPGAGKSSIGQKLADILQYHFVDIDQIIISKNQSNLQDIIDFKGDEALIKLEEETILNLKLENHTIISPGGSIVYSKRAMEYLKSVSIIIFLDVPITNLKKQINNINSRGIVGLKNRTLAELCEERYPVYVKYASIIVKVNPNDTIQSLIDKILNYISEYNHVT